MRAHRVTLLASGLALVTAALAVAGSGASQLDSLDRDLRFAVTTRAAAVEDHLDRARSVGTLTAHNPSFADFYRERADPRRARAQPGLTRDRVHVALGYLERLYGDGIGAASFVDQRTGENARVARGRRAAPAELFPDPDRVPLAARVLRSSVGDVAQSTPYVSAHVGEWVVATATKVPFLPAGNEALISFETTLEAVRRATVPFDTRVAVQVVDAASGRVLTDSRRPVPPPAQGPPGGGGRPVPPAALASDRLTPGVPQAPVDAAGRRYVTQRLAHDAGDANDWVVLASVPAPDALASGAVNPASAGLGLAGLACLLLAQVGFRRHGARLHAQARRDALTGLPNRLQFCERADAYLGFRGGHERAAVLLIDLNRFKEVNDTLGHHVGDLLLAEVGVRLRRALRDVDVPARLDGDEFVVLMTGVEEEEALATARAVVEELDRPVRIEGASVRLSAGIGIAMCPRDATTTSGLLRCADSAMHDAKRGDGEPRVYRPRRQPAGTTMLGLEADLQRTLRHGRIELHYQPLVCLASGAVTGVEALVRWPHPELGLLPPGAFVPMAEERGLLRPLTRAVLRVAVAQAAAWHAEGVGVPVSVNVSSHDLLEPGFPEEVLALVAAQGLPPQRLRLELTESALVENAARASAVLRRLARSGVVVAMDDFGTGYSSLSYLRTLPVGVLKVDRSFIAPLATDLQARLIVRSVVELGHGLGLTVVAEGVEDEATLGVLGELGCDVAQGYHLGRPQPAADTTALLHRARARAFPAVAAPR